MSGNAILIPVDGRATGITLPEGDPARFQAMREALGHKDLQPFRITSNLVVWADEDGPWTQPVNPLLMRLVQRYGQLAQELYGTALLTGTTDEEGESRDLTSDQISSLLSTINSML